MEAHSNIIAGKIPRTEEPGGSGVTKSQTQVKRLSTQHILFHEEHTIWRTVGHLETEC